MKRRTFLQSLFALAGALAIPAVLIAKARHAVGWGEHDFSGYDLNCKECGLSMELAVNASGYEECFGDLGFMSNDGLNKFITIAHDDYAVIVERWAGHYIGRSNYYTILVHGDSVDEVDRLAQAAVEKLRGT